MSLKELQAEQILEYQKKYDALVLIAYEAERFGWTDIVELTIKKASGLKMLLNHIKSDENPINKQPDADIILDSIKEELSKPREGK